MLDLHGHRLLIFLTAVSLLIGIVGAGMQYHALVPHMTQAAAVWMLIWLSLGFVFALVSYIEFVPGFLLCVFCMLIGWRIAGLYDVRIVTIPQCFSCLFLLLNFLYCARQNLQKPQNYLHRYSLKDWQLIFIRMYIGFDFVPHFTEKLFAGIGPHLEDVKYFAGINVPHPDFFVWLAGFCEFGAAVALGLGFLMRLGAMGSILYLFIATCLGGHFLFGFIWANPNGGWEFPIFWLVLMLTFVVTGIHDFSLDQWLEDRFSVPRVLRKIF